MSAWTQPKLTGHSPRKTCLCCANGVLTEYKEGSIYYLSPGLASQCAPQEWSLCSLLQSCSLPLQCGHIEDVVVDSAYRGQKLGLRYWSCLHLDESCIYSKNPKFSREIAPSATLYAPDQYRDSPAQAWSSRESQIQEDRKRDTDSAQKVSCLKEIYSQNDRNGLVPRATPLDSKALSQNCLPFLDLSLALYHNEARTNSWQAQGFAYTSPYIATAKVLYEYEQLTAAGFITMTLRHMKHELIQKTYNQVQRYS